MSVTTLKGTQWYFSTDPSVVSYLGSYNINFRSNNTDYSLLKCVYTSISRTDMYYDTTSVYNRQYVTIKTWTDAAYKTLAISGGDDVTSSTLIDFLETYATLQNVTVYYEAGDYGTGTATTAIKTAGTALTLLGSTFTRSGYNQDGWSINSDGSTLDYSLSGSYTTDDSITLYPHWSLITFYVSFDVQGHGTAPASQLIAQGGLVTRPTNPTATGYVFIGWYKESSCINAWDFATDTVQHTTILYALWGVESSAYVGVNGVARSISKGYVGVNGVARKITKGYIGVNGVARKIF